MNPMESGGPERAHVLIAKFGANTVDQLADELRTFADRLLMGMVTTGVSGSPTAGAIYSYKVRPEQTHDVYLSAVEAWLEERRAAGACAVQDTAAT